MKVKDKLEREFLEEIAKIKEAEVFVGVAHVLRVKLIEENCARPFEDILRDCLSAFAREPMRRRKELCRILKDANSLKVIEVKDNANSSKDPEKELRNENL